MNPYQYSSTIKNFFTTDENSIIGYLTENNNFDSRKTTVDSWIEEIKTLKLALKNYASDEGFVAFEYTIPRVNGRIDCIVCLHNNIFVLEFKTGESQDVNIDKGQLLQYVMDLKNFHFESYDIPLVPMWVVPNAELPFQKISKPTNNDHVLKVLEVSNKTISQTIDNVLKIDWGILEPVNMNNWLLSPYCPTSNIIEAARKLYANHDVTDINRSDSKGEDLKNTTETLLNLIQEAKEKQEKYLCLVTGVPGAGKTLIGLSVATRHQDEEHNNRSVYLSGNRPLVMVLQEALTRDAFKKKKNELLKQLDEITDKNEKKAYKKAHAVTKANIESQVKQFIQLVPNWRKEYLKGICVAGKGDSVKLVKDDKYLYNGTGDYYIPYDHVSIYDEAQRAWDAKENSNYVRKKEQHLKNFPEWSEPHFLISCMDRHSDWAVYICLIGNGQDINHGEAGTKEWINSIKHFKNWKVFAPSDILKNDIKSEDVEDINISFIDKLHLSIDLRSLRAENLASFVDSILNIRIEKARSFLKELDKYPIRITRDLHEAKQWVKNHARINERYGALASSKGQRLKPDALSLLPANSSKSQVVPWFLGDKDKVNSSFYMEDVATEFQVQGLELDWACVAWDADLQFKDNRWQHYQFRSSKWVNINQEKIRRYQINAYRVILTRARRGMIIYVPLGDSEDRTRKSSYYDGIYNYLHEIIGIKTV